MNENLNLPCASVLIPTAGTRLPDALVNAYLNTAYRVGETDEVPGFTLKVGQPSPELTVLMKRFSRSTAAFITAWNPMGQALSEEANRARNRALQQVLTQRSLPHWPGVGSGASGDWPGEESFLVLGLDLEAARRLGRDHEQNALVWAGLGRAPQLVLLV